MPRIIFNYTKSIIVKVCFDDNMVCKELKKALTGLLQYEVEDIKHWIHSLIKQTQQLSQYHYPLFVQI